MSFQLLQAECCWWVPESQTVFTTGFCLFLSICMQHITRSSWWRKWPYTRESESEPNCCAAPRQPIHSRCLVAKLSNRPGSEADVDSGLHKSNFPAATEAYREKANSALANPFMHFQTGLLGWFFWPFLNSSELLVNKCCNRFLLHDNRPLILLLKYLLKRNSIMCAKPKSRLQENWNKSSLNIGS